MSSKSGNETIDDMFARGLALRRQVLGPEYVDKSIANANEFMSAFQRITTEWCWGYAWGRDTLELKTRSMLNLAMLTALNRAAEIKLHVRGAVDNGYAVAMPSYTLCPEARISGIVAEIGAAIEKAATMVEGPIMLTGHSAGGHLVSRMVSATTPLSPAVARRVRHVVSISGLHDLRPLMRAGMNATLRIDEAEALAQSPALLRPMDGARVTCWVGGGERAEFLRQNALLANIWTGLGATTSAVVEPDRHHFSIVDGLADPAHPLTRCLLAI